MLCCTVLSHAALRFARLSLVCFAGLGSDLLLWDRLRRAKLLLAGYDCAMNALFSSTWLRSAGLNSAGHSSAWNALLVSTRLCMAALHSAQLRYIMTSKVPKPIPADSLESGRPAPIPQ